MEGMRFQNHLHPTRDLNTDIPVASLTEAERGEGGRGGEGEGAGFQCHLCPTRDFNTARCQEGGEGEEGVWGGMGFQCQRLQHWHPSLGSHGQCQNLTVQCQYTMSGTASLT